MKADRFPPSITSNRSVNKGLYVRACSPINLAPLKPHITVRIMPWALSFGNSWVSQWLSQWLDTTATLFLKLSLLSKTSGVGFCSIKPVAPLFSVAFEPLCCILGNGQLTGTGSEHNVMYEGTCSQSHFNLLPWVASAPITLPKCNE